MVLLRPELPWPLRWFTRLCSIRSLYPLDVQVLLKGSESSVWADTGTLTETKSYDPAKDKVMYAGPGSVLELGKQIAGFEPRAMERLQTYRWPQDFAQFERILRQLAIMTVSAYIGSSAVTDLLARERSLCGNGAGKDPSGDYRTSEQIICDAACLKNVNRAVVSSP